MLPIILEVSQLVSDRGSFHPLKKSKKYHSPEYSYPDSTLHQVKLELLSNKECLEMFRCSQDHAYYVTKRIALLDHVS